MEQTQNIVAFLIYSSSLLEDENEIIVFLFCSFCPAQYDSWIVFGVAAKNSELNLRGKVRSPEFSWEIIQRNITTPSQIINSIGCFWITLSSCSGTNSLQFPTSKQWENTRCVFNSWSVALKYFCSRSSRTIHDQHAFETILFTSWNHNPRPPNTSWNM